ncbi:MAG: DUF2007 domain-containing protein [Gemmataceae bacterium]
MSDDLVTIGVFPDTFQASIARNAIEAAGVQTYLQGDMSADLFQVSTAIGVRLMVAVKDENEAHRILEELAAGREEMNEEAIREGMPETCELDGAFSESPIDPGLLAPEPIEKQEDVPERIENVNRAFRCSILGLIFPPLMFLSLYFLFLVSSDQYPLPPDAKRRSSIASFIAWPATLAMVLFMLLVCVVR